jgi:hypothetical protein
MEAAMQQTGGGTMFRNSRLRPVWCRLTCSLAIAVVATLLFSGDGLAANRGNSAATITATFADSCRDFAAHSSKDISHVVIHFADGRVVKDERITTPNYAIDGGAGEEIAFVFVKSGTTRERFDCARPSNLPTAQLEINSPPIDQTIATCYDFFSGGLACEETSPRTDWTSSGEIPNNGGTESGVLLWLCGTVAPCQSALTVTFRGTGSTDPDNDIVSWLIDFGDGTTASGHWGSEPPTAIVHDYGLDLASCGGGPCVVTLTVTDSAGQSDSDTMLLSRVDVTPD